MAAFFAVGSLLSFTSENSFSLEEPNSKPLFIGNDPELVGPDRLCNVFGSVVGIFSGEGNPLTDVYSWKIFSPSNQLIFQGAGGAGFQFITYTFSQVGKHRLELSVTRGTNLIYINKKEIDIIKGPILLLKSEYSVCQNQSVTLKALDPTSDNFAEYVFEWRNENQQIVGSQNEFTTALEGIYTVNFSFFDSKGAQVCLTSLKTEVNAKAEIQILASSLQACPDLTINYTTSPLTNGSWYYRKGTNPNLTMLGLGNTFTVRPNQDLPGVGDYEIVFEGIDPDNAACNLKKATKLEYLPQPDFVILGASGASACNSNDGKLKVKALTPLDYISLDGLGISSPSLAAGEVYEFINLESGAYTLISFLGSCSNSYGSVIPLTNPPSQLQFKIQDIKGDYCTAIGKENGSFTVQFLNGKIDGSYRILNIKGTVVEQVAFLNQETFIISIPGGLYYFEVFDDQGCNLPESLEIDVPSLNQVDFFVPATLSICQSYDLIPITTDDLVFELTSPSGLMDIKKAGEPLLISEEGEYTLVASNPSKPELCPNLLKFKVNLVDPVVFEPELISEDCIGNRTYIADIAGRDPLKVKFNWRNEKDEIIGTGQFLDLAPSSFGTYSLDVQPLNSIACPAPPKDIEIKKPILSVDITLETTKLCEFGPKAILSITTTDFEEVTDIEWRRFDTSGQIEELPQTERKMVEIIADKEGIYEASVYSIIPSIDKSCELGRRTISLDLTLQKVDFTIPEDLSICDPFAFIPQSSVPLTFTLTAPDGSIQTKDWNEAFILSLSGEYTILGYNPDLKSPLCPEQKSFTVVVNNPVQFTPEFVNLTCDGIYEFAASITNYKPEDVDIFWRDASGSLLGTDQTLFLSEYGSFELEVQPKGSVPCSNNSILFDAPVPTLFTDVRIINEPLCADQLGAALTLESTYESVNSIQWWFTNLGNVRTQLTGETNKREILALEEGTYEVFFINKFGCEIGNDLVLNMRSMDTVRPIVKESYQICPRYNIGETIDPGQFAAYEWYHEGFLVSMRPTFKPITFGDFTLIVYSEEGCGYQTTFVTIEECELKVSFPNAIHPGNPDKEFLIYTNYLIDELEVFVLNKWGEVIFYCENKDLITEQSTCAWDGSFDGKRIPPGSYAVRINYKNLEKNITKYYVGSILVIE